MEGRSIDVRSGYGNVIIKPLKDNNHVKVGGTSIFLDTSFQKEKHAITCGEVVSVTSQIDESLHTDIEVQIGDIVFFHYLCVINAIRDDKYFIRDRQPYYPVNYESLYVAKRGDKVICLNGFMLVSPIMKYEDQKIGNVWVPDSMLKEEALCRGMIAFMGNPLKGQKQLASVGDAVLFRKYNQVPLQYGLHASFDGDRKYYRMRMDNIMGVERPISQSDSSSDTSAV